MLLNQADLELELALEKRDKRDHRFFTVNLSQWAHPAPSRVSGVKKRLHGGTY